MSKNKEAKITIFILLTGIFLTILVWTLQPLSNFFKGIIISLSLGASIAFYLYKGLPDFKDNPLCSIKAQNKEVQKLKELLPYLRKYLEAHPKDQQAWNLLGQASDKTGSIQESIFASYQASQLNPQN
jgi:cytochrome c-type biogenesis protein CcmH/NrfG